MGVLSRESGRTPQAVMDDDIQDDEDLAARDDAPLQDAAPGQIRALARGLAVLEALNRQPGATVTEIAAATGLARTTSYRVLETLGAAGFAQRTADERYHLLAGVHRLADGFEDEAWIAGLAKPATAALAKDLAWPLLLATPHGIGLKAHRLSGGGDALPPRLSLTGSAAGLAYLSALPVEARAALLTLAGVDRTAIAPVLADTATRGAAKVEREADIGLAVPVCLGNVVIAALGVTIPRAALAPEQAPDQSVDRITALLGHAAAEIAAAVLKDQPMAETAAPAPAKG